LIVDIRLVEEWFVHEDLKQSLLAFEIFIAMDVSREFVRVKCSLRTLSAQDFRATRRRYGKIRELYLCLWHFGGDWQVG